MSELIMHKSSHGDFRWRLLATVSALALTSAVAGGTASMASDPDGRPTVWIELGGQLEKLQSSEDVYRPPFFSPPPSFVVISPEVVQRGPRFSNGAEGKLEFQPSDSDWTFTAAIRFGRSNSKNSAHQQSPSKFKLTSGFSNPYFTPDQERYANLSAQHAESHAVLDFSVGKDVGFGLFGSHSDSTVSLGIHFAQFTAASNADAGALPRVVYTKYLIGRHFPLIQPHFFRGTEAAERSFQGLGPSVSWNADADVLSMDRSKVTLDWGAGASLLFGRQKVRIHRKTAGYIAGTGNNHISTTYRTTSDLSRRRAVIVPNVSGFVGASLRFPTAKISLGYRGDFYFGAMDGGIVTRKDETTGFYGPFATISIGLGG